MTGKTHILGGLALSAATIALLKRLGFEMSVPSELAGMASSAVAALFPDIDEPNSTISHKLPFISGLFAVNRFSKKAKSYNPFLSKEAKREAKRQARDAGHRGVTHYFITCAIVSLLALAAAFVLRKYEVIASALIGVAPGYFSHIALDLISGRIPVLAPFKRKSVGVCIFRTGSITEKVFVRLALLLGVGCCVFVAI